MLIQYFYIQFCIYIRFLKSLFHRFQNRSHHLRPGHKFYHKPRACQDGNRGGPEAAVLPLVLMKPFVGNPPPLYNKKDRKNEQEVINAGMRTIHESVFLAEGARVVNKVSIGARSSVWYNAVIRGDDGGVRIGERTNVQDNAVIHAGRNFPVRIGDGVTIAHGAIVHGCTIGSDTLIGMGAVIMKGVVIGQNCIIGAGALLTRGTVVPDGSIAIGNPAKVSGKVSEENERYIRDNADFYVTLAEEYRREGR